MFQRREQLDEDIGKCICQKAPDKILNEFKIPLWDV